MSQTFDQAAHQAGHTVMIGVLSDSFLSKKGLRLDPQAMVLSSPGAPMPFGLDLVACIAGDHGDALKIALGGPAGEIVLVRPEGVDTFANAPELLRDELRHHGFSGDIVMMDNLADYLLDVMAILEQHKPRVAIIAQALHQQGTLTYGDVCRLMVAQPGS